MGPLDKAEGWAVWAERIAKVGMWAAIASVILVGLIVFAFLVFLIVMAVSG